MRDEAPLIIGAGPAGCAAAIALGQYGTRSLLLEAARETGDALCGGFLSWRTLETLQTLGVDAQGHRVTQLMLAAGKLTACAPLPLPATGISRRRLDSLMVARAENLGAGVERGVTVRALGNGVRLADATILTPQQLFVASGKHGLRGLERKPPGEPALGLRLRLPAHPKLQQIVGDRIELHLFAGGYAGLVLQEDGSANLCMAVRKPLLSAANGDPAGLFRALGDAHPVLAERLAYWDGDTRIDAIGAVPYGWLATSTAEGQYLLGDAAACIPSLAGEGNGLAIASGAQAAYALLNGLGSPAFQSAYADRVRRPINRAMRLWHLAERPAFARLSVRSIQLAPWLAGMAANLTRIGH